MIDSSLGLPKENKYVMPISGFSFKRHECFAGDKLCDVVLPGFDKDFLEKGKRTDLSLNLLEIN